MFRQAQSHAPRQSRRRRWGRAGLRQARIDLRRPGLGGERKAVAGNGGLGKALAGGGEGDGEIGEIGEGSVPPPSLPHKGGGVDRGCGSIVARLTGRHPPHKGEASSTIFHACAKRIASVLMPPCARLPLSQFCKATESVTAFSAIADSSPADQAKAPTGKAGDSQVSSFCSVAGSVIGSAARGRGHAHRRRPLAKTVLRFPSPWPPGRSACRAAHDHAGSGCDRRCRPIR